jgi:hypothetical protein
MSMIIIIMFNRHLISLPKHTTYFQNCLSFDFKLTSIDFKRLSISDFGDFLNTQQDHDVGLNGFT